MKKCDYCAKEISYHEQYCSDDCQRKANQYYEKSDKFAKPFMVINVICVFGIPVGLFILPLAKAVGAAIAAFSCVILGIMLILLPFPTESMIKKHKIENAVRRTRLFGMGVIVLGLAIVGTLFFIFN